MMTHRLMTLPEMMDPRLYSAVESARNELICTCRSADAKTATFRLQVHKWKVRLTVIVNGYTFSEWDMDELTPDDRKSLCVAWERLERQALNTGAAKADNARGIGRRFFEITD